MHTHDNNASNHFKKKISTQNSHIVKWELIMNDVKSILIMRAVYDLCFVCMSALAIAMYAYKWPIMQSADDTREKNTKKRMK